MQKSSPTTILPTKETTTRRKEKDDESTTNVVEDDWSDILQDADLLGGFAKHETKMVPLPFQNGKPASLSIASVAKLSPLDMVALSGGDADATGHCVWMGARLWIQSLSALDRYLSQSRHVLELGSGTGVAGLSVAVMMNRSLEQVILTDNSSSALDLCRRNCAANQDLLSCPVNVQALEWGGETNESPTSSGASTNCLQKGGIDTILATDVIYDVGAWVPLLRTVCHYLTPTGTFLLSHVPRAALPPGYASMDAYLRQVAVSDEFGLECIEQWYPTHDGLSFPGAFEMNEAGASIMVFRRR